MADTPNDIALVPVEETGENEREAYVVDPFGSLASVPLSQLDRVGKDRGRILSNVGLKEYRLERDAREADIQTFAEGAASGLTAGLSDVALVKSGLTSAEDLERRKRVNPVASIGGEIVGTVAGVAATGGVGSLVGKGIAKAGAKGLAKAGLEVAGAPLQAAIRTGVGVEKATQAVLAGRVPTTLAQIASKGAGLATEGAVLGSMRGVAKSQLDPEFTADAFASEVGLGALLSGSVGALGVAGKAALSKAVPAALRGATVAGKAAVREAAPLISKVSGVDAAELRALATAEKAAINATKVANTVASPHAGAIGKQLLKLEKASRAIAKEGVPISVRDIKSKVSARAANEVAQEAVSLSRTARVAAEQSGDDVARIASELYDTTVARLKPANAVGRFNAALKLRNSLSKVPSMQGVVKQLDDHLGNEKLYQLGAKEFANKRNIAENFKGAQALFDADTANPARIGEILKGVRPGVRGELDSLSQMAGQLDEYLAVTKGGKNAGLLREAAQASKRLRAAVDAAEKAVAAPNAKAEAAQDILSGRASKAAEIAKNLLPNTPSGQAIRKLVEEASPSGLVGMAAGSLVGNPGAGALLGNIAGAARDPKRFLGTLERLHEVAGSIEANHTRMISNWMRGRDVTGKTLKTAAKVSPSLAKMVSAKSPQERRKHYVEYRKSIVDNANNPEKMVGALSSVLEPVRSAHPELSERILSASLHRVRKLVDSLPPEQGESMFGMEDVSRVSDAAVNRFMRVANIVENPTNILPRIAEGTVTRDEVVALRETAPGYHQFLMQVISEHVPESKLPYSRKLTLGTVFEVPTTGGLKHINLHQAVHQYQPQQKQGINTRAPQPAAQGQMTALDSVPQR